MSMHKMGFQGNGWKYILLSALFVFAGAGAFLGVSSGGGEIAASSEESYELLLPGTREEYLPLESASASAFSEGSFAIADKSTLYVYDRAEKEYTAYSHLGTTGEPCELSAVAYTYDGKLFFSDAETHLYRYDVQKDTAELVRDITCASFAISSDTLYFSAVANTGTTIYAVPHGNPAFENATKVGELGQSSIPRLYAGGGKLYCAVDSLVYIYERSDSGFTRTQQLLSGSSPTDNLRSICCYQDEIYYADGSGLYRSKDNERELILSGEDVRSLSVYDNKLYVTASGVREATIGADGSLVFTGYEIAGGSASFNRLSGAQAVSRGGELIVAADTGNGRALVYNTSESSFTAYPCGSVGAVATDGDIIAAAAENSLFLYHRGESEPFYRIDESARVTGVAVISGRCYYATETSFGEAWEGGARRDSGISCVALAGDLMGNLYAVDAQGSVTRYREETFARESGDILDFMLPVGFRSLSADFEGNLYCLVGRDMYKNGAIFATAPEAFKGDTPVSVFPEDREDAFLFGYENYILRVRGLGAPILDGIPTSNLDERVFSVPASGEISTVSVPEGLPGIVTDLGALRGGAGSFSCESLRRTAGGSGVLLGRTQNFVLCALYEDFSYTIYLFPMDRVYEGEPETREPNVSKMFTLTETKLLGYPCLTAALERELLPRAYPLTVLKELKIDEGFGFAYVETEDGVRGYLPTNLLSSVEPTEREPEGYRIGYLKASSDGVVFRTDSGETMNVHDRRRVRIFDSGEGRYMVSFEENGMTYTAQVTGQHIENGSTNMIRISFIIVLLVVAVMLCAVYVILIRPKKR